MVGIVAYGAYVPRLRLNRQAVYDSNKWFAAGLRGLAKGERSMANWDEDSITMAVEASRDCLTSHQADDVRSLYFASTTHPFKDRQNAGVIGTALSIEQNLSAADVGGSLKAGTSALVAGLNASKNGGGPALVAAADKRLARVASANELNYGDGAAALLCGTENVIAKLVGHHSVSMDFVDHFRGDETDFDYGWEERWIRDEGYSKIVPPAIKAALVACNLKGTDITPFTMPSLMPAVRRQMARSAASPTARCATFWAPRWATPGPRTRWSCWSTRWSRPRKATRSWWWPSARASTSWCSRSRPRTPGCPSARACRAGGRAARKRRTT